MTKFIVELEQNDWQMILSLLSTAAYRDVAPLINKITQQLSSPSPMGANGAEESKGADRA